jgi:hypothetical protein
MAHTAELQAIYTQLQELGCLEPWIENAYDANQKIGNEVICDAFNWEASAEGWDYWNDLNDEVGKLPEHLRRRYWGRELVEIFRGFETVPELLAMERLKTWKN